MALWRIFVGIDVSIRLDVAVRPTKIISSSNTPTGIEQLVEKIQTLCLLRSSRPAAMQPLVIALAGKAARCSREPASGSGLRQEHG